MKIPAILTESCIPKLQFSIELKFLLNNTRVAYYNSSDEDDYGYQRRIEKTHLRRLIKHVKSEGHNISFPTPLILGAIRSDVKINKIKIKDSVGDFVEIERIRDVPFSVIDGQHRLEALRSVYEEDESLGDVKIMCVLAIVENDKDEVEMFIDINSKAKKIKPDLALLSKNKLALKYSGNDKESFLSFVTIKTAFNLNNDQKSVWLNAVKFDFNEEDSGSGLVGVSSFVSSLTEIVKQFVKNNYPSIVFNIHNANKVAEELEILLYKCWKIVRDKWPSCFHLKYQETASKGLFYYNESFEIQKYAGYNAIHSLINKIYRDGMLENELILKFSETIYSSKIKSEEWERGGRFSGRTSGAGIKKSVDDIEGGHSA